MSYIGIDLGTTFSTVAYLDREGQPVTIPNAEGELTTPSVVWFESDDAVVVGRDARRAGLVEPDRVAEDVKRFIGDEHYPKLILGKKLSPISLSAIILKKLKQDAEARLTRIDGAVITVPAYFDEHRRQATAAAAEAAGLPLIDIINEPTAAALAHAFQSLVNHEGDAGAPTQLVPDGRTIVVYDLGGGTFDVTILRAEGTNLTVQATAGDVRLGGRDWDERIFNYLCDLFVREHGDDPRDDALSRQQLYGTAEDLKKDLSRRGRTMFVVNHAGNTLRGELTREQFDDLTADLLFRTESRLNRVLRDAGMKWEDVNEVLLVGGSTRLPQVREMVKRVTGKEPTATVSPDEAVAHGAAIHAAIAVANLTEGESAVAGKAGVPKEEVVPASAGAEVEPQQQPGPAVETGEPGSLVNQLAAALDVESGQAVPPPLPSRMIDDGQRQRFLSSLAGRICRLLGLIRTTNVNAHSLGVVAEDRRGRKRVVRLIPRNTRLPAQKEKCFATVTDDQHRVVVQIVEGESDSVEDCVQIGTCLIESLPKGLPKGSPIEITFRYDGSGRLFVQAVHLTSGAWAETSIHRGGGVDPKRVHLNQEILSKLRVS